MYMCAVCICVDRWHTMWSSWYSTSTHHIHTDLTCRPPSPPCMCHTGHASESSKKYTPVALCNLLERFHTLDIDVSYIELGQGLVDCVSMINKKLERFFTVTKIRKVKAIKAASTQHGMT